MNLGTWRISLVFFFLFSYAKAFDQLVTHERKQEFVKSFLINYEFGPEGRYVHEYHSFILGQTRDSFEALEDRLRDEGLKLCGRYGILGYEENAVPNYYTDFRKSTINDEATLKNNAGWSLKLHNRFGFMTGFLFKDINEMFAPDEDRTFFHINPHVIALFDDHASVFQEHAFGEALDVILQARALVMAGVQSGDVKQVCGLLIKFWEILYHDALKIGNKQIAGTQDILFSIEASRHLVESGLPVLKYFMGPDITYPIEIFSKQAKEATYNSQTFVKKFARTLNPVEQEPTVYVFCSFVDGVGKSTMLGNIKNWMKHHDNVDMFDHVDNSSSQLAELFQFRDATENFDKRLAQVFKLKDRVYIADLPAQISHFTYKPDGLVYVDVLTMHDENHLKALQQYVRQNVSKLEYDYHENLESVSEIIVNKGFFDEQVYSIDNPAMTFLRNLVLLKKTNDNSWIPFEKDGEHYLFNAQNMMDIRILTTLADVKSEGLKNIESEQMMFFQGIRFPLPYNLFVDDLVDKLKSENISRVIFVDFLSMYPRSSRENIRINYLLQQMALLDPVFEIKKSIYKDFVSGGELLYSLKDFDIARALRKGLHLETQVRLLLYQLILRRDAGDLTGIDCEELTSVLHNGISTLDKDFNDIIHQLCMRKVNQEEENQEKLYGLSKSYVNIQQFSFDDAYKFGQLIEELFTKSIRHKHLNQLWESPGKLYAIPDSFFHGDGQVDTFTDEQEMVRLFHAFSSECKDEVLLTPMLRALRANWYAALNNVFDFESQYGQEYSLNFYKYRVVPYFLKKLDDDDMFYVIRRHYEAWQKKIPADVRAESRRFNLPLRGQFVEVEDAPHRLDWQSINTATSLYAYGHSSSKKTNGFSSVPLISRYIQKHQGSQTAASVMPVSDLYTQLKESMHWKMELDELQEKAEKNSRKLANKKLPVRTKAGSKVQKKKKIVLGLEHQKHGAQLLLRMLATLEMIMKDPEADVVIRKGNRDDFKAALKLMEATILPEYFNIYFVDKLFEDYDRVEPYPSWFYWE
jgi:hypothetical protein